MSIVLGCIADDFTGATDLANTLVGQGMRTVQLIGVPAEAAEIGDADAVVVALKSRTAAADEAVRWSLDALAWLRARGAAQIFFKYCSTFDSTDQGNIGPVSEALLQALGSDFTIACPAFPTNGRTVFQGYLFVGNHLLSESGMQDHPLTPMTDPSLVRVLGRQTRHPVGLVPFATVSRGAEAIREAFRQLRASKKWHAVVDAVTDTDLLAIGSACRDLPLVTGASGVAQGLPQNFRHDGLLGAAAQPRAPQIAGRSAVLAGSCSAATRAQVEVARNCWPSFMLDPLEMTAGRQTVDDILDWADASMGDGPLLIYSSAPPRAVHHVQQELGRQHAGELVEHCMGRIASGLVQRGVRRLIVAGGETSGAVVQSLAVSGLRIGPEIDPGVPWCETIDQPALALALKSGNFGTDDFFLKACGMLP